ncbi:hypothetical protein VTN00DRAFT_2869 [Thermoascus crustaceus]
MYTDFRV